MSVPREGLWIVSDRIVDFRFFVKFHMSGPAIIFRCWSITEHVSYASKKLLFKQKTSSTWCVLLWKDYGWFLIELSIWFLNYHRGCQLCIKKLPNQEKDLINIVSVTLEGWWMVSDRTVDFDFSSNFPGPDLQ